MDLEDDRQESTDKQDPLKERRDSREKQDEEKPKELDRSKFGISVGKIGMALLFSIYDIHGHYTTGKYKYGTSVFYI